MNKIKINSNQKIHFVGIGGIGMSGLAQIMKNMGFKIQGSDMASSKNVERCRKIGIKVFRSHKRQNINNTSILIKSSAIKSVATMLPPVVAPDVTYVALFANAPKGTNNDLPLFDL